MCRAQRGHRTEDLDARAGSICTSSASDAAKSPNVIMRRPHLALFVALIALGSAPVYGAAPGSVIAMWGTGLSGTGTITANIGGQNIATPYYAGPAPGIPGVQQINLVVPTSLAPGTTQVYVCGTVSGGSPVCSIPAPLTIN